MFRFFLAYSSVAAAAVLLSRAGLFRITPAFACIVAAGLVVSLLGVAGTLIAAAAAADRRRCIASAGGPSAGARTGVGAALQPPSAPAPERDFGCTAT